MFNRQLTAINGEQKPLAGGYLYGMHGEPMHNYMSNYMAIIC